MSPKWNLGAGGVEGGWQQVEGERLWTLWFGLNRAKKNVWVWIMQHFWPGPEIDAWFVWGSDIISVAVLDRFHVFLSLGCLSASSLNFFSLDYQQCNWVREQRGTLTAAQARFLWNPSKLTAELWEVNKTSGSDLALRTRRVYGCFCVSAAVDFKPNKIQKCEVSDHFLWSRITWSWRIFEKIKTITHLYRSNTDLDSMNNIFDLTVGKLTHCISWLNVRGRKLCRAVFWKSKWCHLVLIRYKKTKISCLHT